MKRIAVIFFPFLLLCGCSTTSLQAPQLRPFAASQFPAGFKALEKISMKIDHRSYEWMGYVLLQDNQQLVAQVMEPAGVPVIKMKVNHDGSFDILQKGEEPPVTGFERVLAGCFGAVFIADSYPVSNETNIIYSGKIQGTGLSGVYPNHILYESNELKIRVVIEVLNIKAPDVK